MVAVVALTIALGAGFSEVSVERKFKEPVACGSWFAPNDSQASAMDEGRRGDLGIVGFTPGPERFVARCAGLRADREPWVLAGFGLALLALSAAVLLRRGRYDVKDRD